MCVGIRGFLYWVVLLLVLVSVYNITKLSFTLNYLIASQTRTCNRSGLRSNITLYTALSTCIVINGQIIN
jgi:hypothetical protein